jgi:hypothetical protein
MNATLREFAAAAPRPQRDALRVLLCLASRPRGRRLLSMMPLALQAADNLLAMAHWDDPGRARMLGWDAEAIALRGRELRRSEGRP